MIIPLTDSQGVVGTLKIYYAKKYDMSHSKKSLAIGFITNYFNTYGNIKNRKDRK